MALLNFKYGQGTPASYEQGTIYVSTDNKKIYVGDPSKTGEGFCAGDFIEVPVAASNGQVAALKELKGPQQNVLYLTYNTTDGYDLWKYNGTDFINLTKTGSILKLISDLTGVVEGINTGLNNYVLKADAPGYTDILTKTAAAGIYELIGEAQRVVSAYDQATVQPIAADLEQLGKDVAANKTAAENALTDALKEYTKTGDMNTAISTAVGTAKTEILGEEGYAGTVKGAYEEAAAKADAAKTAVLGEEGYAQTVKSAYELAGKAESDAANAHAAANTAKGIADGAVERLNTAEPKIEAVENKLADITEGTVGDALEALKEEILGEEGSTGTIAEALSKAQAAQTTADNGVKLAGEAQDAADAAQKAADDAQATADGAVAKLVGITETVVKHVQDVETTLRDGYAGSLNDLSSAAGTAQTAAEAAQKDATQGLKDAAAAKQAADDAQADATEALTALGTVTDVAGAIATAKSEILGGSTSTLKAAETAIETLDTKVDDLIEDIDNLSNIMNFIGVTESELKDGENSTPVIANNADYAPKAGDVVIYSATEFVYDGSVWQKIGNTSAETEELAALDLRLDNLEGKVKDSSVLVKAVDQNTDDIEDHETRIQAAEKDIDDIQLQLTWGTFTSL